MHNLSQRTACCDRNNYKDDFNCDGSNKKDDVKCDGNNYKEDVNCDQFCLRFFMILQSVTP